MLRLSTLFVILLALATVGCDQSTKHFAVSALQESPQTLLPGITLVYTENRDMAFGLLQGFLGEESRLWLLTCAKSFAILAGLGFYVARRKISSVLERTSVGLILSGAMGNLIDRLNHGFVVDFVQVPHWPVFNVADVAIVLGGGLLFLDAFLRERRSLSPSPSILARPKNDLPDP